MRGRIICRLTSESTYDMTAQHFYTGGNSLAGLVPAPISPVSMQAA